MSLKLRCTLFEFQIRFTRPIEFIESFSPRTDPLLLCKFFKTTCSQTQQALKKRKLFVYKGFAIVENRIY